MVSLSVGDLGGRLEGQEIDCALDESLTGAAVVLSQGGIMSALEIFRGKLAPSLINTHKKTLASMWRGVESLINGGKLWLTALGRNLPGTATEKSKIKAIDRLLGNSKLSAELTLIYHALASILLYRVQRPIILVDITEIRTNICALTASIAHDGRSLPLYGIVRSKKYIASQKCKNCFLRRLAAILPANTIPTLVTDAGFESPWFDDVQERGWDYVGRVRHRTRFLDGDNWLGPEDLHRRATGRAKNLGKLAFPKRNPKKRRLVLSAKPKCKGRKRKNKRGKPGRTANDKRYRKSASEPWLLATSLQSSAKAVIAIYALRMQIEQNYRDAKSHRWGWAFDQTGSKTNERLEVLLLLAALAANIVQGVGRAGEQKNLQRRFQANTVTDRRVLSLFFLGLRLLRAENQELLTKREILQGFNRVRLEIRIVEREAQE